MTVRLRWFVLGAVAGAVATVRMRARAEALLDRYAPVRGAVGAMGAARQVRRDVDEALRRAKQKMDDTTDELRTARHERRAQAQAAAGGAERHVPQGTGTATTPAAPHAPDNTANNPAEPHQPSRKAA